MAAAMSKIVTPGNKRVIDDARKRLPEYLLAAAAIYHTRGDRAAVAHWPFDAATGKTVVATVGPGGRLANVSPQAPGKVPTRVEDGQIGRALRFGRGRVVEADAKALQPLAFAKSGDFRSRPGFGHRRATRPRRRTRSSRRRSSQRRCGSSR
ncbi:MAG: hypothetical protein CM1200mP2_13750 [Planctomycetaceae bacterium]|nr:MAG: hypothetical protein CM1200mP2_13750 [Planctomycetaceae bacterium]